MMETPTSAESCVAVPSNLESDSVVLTDKPFQDMTSPELDQQESTTLRLREEISLNEEGREEHVVFLSAAVEEEGDMDRSAAHSLPDGIDQANLVTV